MKHQSIILRALARGVSYLAHPLLLPTVAFVFLTALPGYHSTVVAPVRWMLVLLVFLFTFLIPVLIVMMLKTSGRVKSLQMEDRAERTLPYIITALVYYLSYRFLMRAALPPMYPLVLLGATTMVALAVIINLRWKISIHMMGIGGACGLLHGLAHHFPHHLFAPTVFLIMLAGLTGFARLYLGSHRPKEVYAGFVTGYLVFFLLFGQIL